MSTPEPTTEVTPDVAQTVAFANTALPDVIEARDVSQSYDGGKTWVMKGLNFLVEDTPDVGQFEVILGVSGCGKSTLLRYFAGLQVPTSGEIRIHSRARTRKDAISMVFQQYSSFPWYTVLENVMLGLKYRGVSHKEAVARAMEMINKVGLRGHERKQAVYPTLSGGQLQRVAIARSLVNNPDILLMDEPFGALDTNTRQAMQYLVSDLYNTMKSTIIFVTHDIPEAVFLADRIHIMRANPGQVVFSMKVDLPAVRTRETKRDPQFQKLVAYVEDVLTDVCNQRYPAPMTA